MTTPTDSRMGPGTLTLGTDEFGPQISNVRLSADNATEDGTKTLGDPTPAVMVTTTWTLAGTAIQDWTDVAGFVEYCRLNNNTTDTFSWVPVTDGPTFSGSCVVTAVEIGGDVGTQLTTDFEFVVTGALVRTEHV